MAPKGRFNTEGYTPSSLLLYPALPETAPETDISFVVLLLNIDKFRLDPLKILIVLGLTLAIHP